MSGVVQVNVAFIGNHIDAALVGHHQNGSELFRIKHRTTGIVGAVDDDGAGARADVLLDHLGGELKAVFLAGFHVDAASASVFNDVFERNPVGNGQNHFIAMIHQHLDSVKQGEFSSSGDDGFFGPVVGAEIRRMALYDGGAQFRDAGNRRVLGEILLNGSDGCVLDVLRRGEVRLSGAELHHVCTSRLKLTGFSNHCHGGGDFDAVYTIAELLDCGGSGHDAPHFDSNGSSVNFSRSFCSTNSGTSPRTEPPRRKISFTRRELR